MSQVKYMAPCSLADQFNVIKTAEEIDRRVVAEAVDSFEDLFTLEDLVNKLVDCQGWSWEDAVVAVVQNIRYMIDAGLAVVHDFPDED